MRRRHVRVELGVPQKRGVLHEVEFLIEIGFAFKPESINRAIVLFEKNYL